jgi:hypothetical protein
VNRGEHTGRAALVWLTVAALGLVDAWTAHPSGVCLAEFGTGPAGVLISIGASLFNLFGGKIDANVKRALDGMRLTLARSLEVVAAFMKDTGKTTSRGIGILSRFWEAVLLPFLKKADGRLLRIYKWLKDTFGPIVSALLWLRKHIVDFYGKWFRPIFDTIDAVRGILRLLGVLHVEFAKKLDDKLARLEARLLKPLRVALETINTLIDWTERIIDLNGFFQRYTLIRSMLLHERDVWRVWWASAHKRDQESPPAPQTWPAPPTSANVSESIIVYAQDRSGPDAAASKELAQDIVLYARQRVGGLL